MNIEEMLLELEYYSTFFPILRRVYLIKFCKGFIEFKVPTKEFTIIDFHSPQLNTLDLEKCGATWWVLDPVRSWPAKGKDPQVLVGSAQPALVGVMPNIWPGFVDQVVDKWVNEWKERTNEWMNVSIQRMLVFKVQRGLVPPHNSGQSKRWCLT